MPQFKSYAQGAPCYIELTTPDREAARRFYSALFGWNVVDVPVDDQGNSYLTAELQGDVVAGIGGQLPEDAGKPAFWGVFLAVDDVDEAAELVELAGGTLEAAPFDVMDLGRMAAVVDPTGARINFWQAKTMVGTARASEPCSPIWNELTTPDPSLAAEFYVDVLDLATETSEIGGTTYTTLATDGGSIAGVVPPMVEGIPPHWSVYFNVKDVDGTVADVADLGGRIISGPFDVPDVGRMAVVSDPQGGMFALMADLD